MNNLDKINQTLLALFGSEETVREWWITPHNSFGNKTPKEAYDRDRDVVKAYIIKLLKW